MLSNNLKKALLKNSKKWAITSVAVLGLGLAGGMFFNANANAKYVNPNAGKSANVTPKVIINKKDSGDRVTPTVIIPGSKSGKNVKPTIIIPGKDDKPNKDGKVVKPKLIMPNHPFHQNNDGQVVKPKVLMPNGQVVKPKLVIPNHPFHQNNDGQIVVPKLVMPKHNGQSKHYHHATITKVTVPKHFRWFMITKTSLAHNHLMLIGTNRDYKYKLRPNHDITMRIVALYKVSRHGHSFYQYEVKINGHHYFVTSKSSYTPNAYYQNSDLKNSKKRHGTYRVRVIQNCKLYSRANYSHKTFVKNVRRGTILHAKKIINIGRKGDYQTRFLVKGHARHAHKLYVTSNKNWVKLL